MVTANLLGGSHVSRVAHGALRLGCCVVSWKQRTEARSISFLWTRYLLSGNLDWSGYGLTVRQGMQHSRRSRNLSIARRVDYLTRCHSRMVEAYQRRCGFPKVPVPLWQSTQRISQFERVPGRFRLRWLVSHSPGPLPLPLFLKLKRLLQRIGGPCDLRRHSQCPLQRSQADWMTAGENSKLAAIQSILTRP